MRTCTDICWAVLAAAIIKKGQQENDTEFLNSQWCKDLKDLVATAADKEKKSDIESQNITGALNGSNIK